MELQTTITNRSLNPDIEAVKYIYKKWSTAKRDPLNGQGMWEHFGKVVEDFNCAGKGNVAFSLNNLAALLDDMGKYDEAKPLYERSLKIRETVLSENLSDISISLNNLALLLDNEGGQTII
jgi:tetratricopeptide (TPR) repeat protein